MTLYRLRLELRSSLVTPLKGDTIWGHMVWGIANHEGEAEVAHFLEQEKGEHPALVVSSAFPAGMVCRALPLPVERGEALTIKDYSQIKKNRKIKYEKASQYFDDVDKSTELTEIFLKTERVTRNTINRLSNTVVEDGLYTIEEKWSDIAEWDFYVLSSFSMERIRTLAEWAFEFGYGADASTGKGRIILKGDPVPVKAKHQGTAYMALGPFVDPRNQLLDIRADVFIRMGKIGGAFASGLSPYKKPVVLYDEGAVFTSAEPIQYAGALLEEMHGQDDRICQSGFAPVIPIA